MLAITRKIFLSHIYPLIPYFYLVKIGNAGVNLFFLLLLEHIDYGYSMEPPQRGSSNVSPQSIFEQKYKISNFFFMKFSIFTMSKNRSILHGKVFVKLLSQTFSFSDCAFS